jgi:hypothetical protein
MAVPNKKLKAVKGIKPQVLQTVQTATIKYLKKRPSVYFGQPSFLRQGMFLFQ